MRTSIATRANLDLIDENYRRWQEDPESVDPSWSAFFEGFELGNLPQRNGAAAGPSRLRRIGKVRSKPGSTDSFTPIARSGTPSRDSIRSRRNVRRIRQLSSARARFQRKRSRSARFVEILLRQPADDAARDDRDCWRAFTRTRSAPSSCTFKNPRIRNWVLHRLESRPDKRDTPRPVQIAMLRALLEAESFEVFLHTRYVGQKRFSLQGAESLMVILDTILHKCPGDGVEEICMGMAHRGRLNVLANFLKKSLQVIFTEFTENYIPDLVAGDGDVKYHLGYRTVRKLANGAQVEIRLAANPSHLEAVDPVVEGKARARQRIRGDTEHRRKVLPLLVHGDAAFAGQGIVAETLNMSQLHGYGTGGTVHVVVNNQIGFTTLPEDARSSMYATDIAKMIEAPIFHVNGDDPLAVWFVSQLALDFRQEFGRDVVIDMYCYRRYGHNEGDEPSFTQPDLYAKIEKRPSVAQLYKDELLEAGRLERGRRRLARNGIRTAPRNDSRRKSKSIEKDKAGEQAKFKESTAVFQPEYTSSAVSTAHQSRECLKTIVDGLTRVPDGFNVQPKIQRIVLDHRRQVFEKGGPYEWHYAEALAFGSLLLEGIPVRLSGQDSSRGTFSTRHSVLYDGKTGEPYVPLMHLGGKTGAYLRLQQSALRSRRARVRLRILARLSEHALPVGSAVRRFRQWRADHHRSVHRPGRIEMAAAERDRAAPAPRLRRPGSGTFQRPARTLFCSSAPRTTFRSAT